MVRKYEKLTPAEWEKKRAEKAAEKEAQKAEKKAQKERQKQVQTLLFSGRGGCSFHDDEVLAACG